MAGRLQIDDPNVDDIGALALSDYFPVKRPGQSKGKKALISALAAIIGGGGLVLPAPAASGDQTGATDTAAVQALIDTASALGGGTVGLVTGNQYWGNVVLKNGVVFKGDDHFGIGFGTSPAPKTQWAAATSAPAIDTPTDQLFGAAVIGISVVGKGGLVSGLDIGIRFQKTSWCAIKNVSVRNCGDQGILSNLCVAGVYEDILIAGCVLNTTRLADAGAFEVHGTDTWFSRIETGTSQIAKSSGSALHCVGFINDSAGSMMSGVVGELSDRGIVVKADFVCAVNCRADTNFGHGFDLVGAHHGKYAACWAFNNGTTTNNTYDNWSVDGSGGNRFSACSSIWNGGTANQPRYGFNDACNTATNLTARNYYDSSCGSVGHATAAFNLTDFGSHVDLPRGPYIAFTDGATTPSVAGAVRFVTLNSGSTTITNFTGGIPGQEIVLWIDDTHTTIKNNANILLLGATDITPHVRSILRFQYHAGVWTQEGTATA